MDMAVVELKRYTVRKKHGEYLLNNVNMILERGEVTALIGGSRSEKVSLMETIAGIGDESLETFGEVIASTEDGATEKAAEKRRINAAYIPGTPPVYKNIEIGGLLRSIAIFYKRPHERLKELMKWARIKAVRKTPYKNLAEKTKKRIALVIALLRDREVTVWDEPLADLSTNYARSLISKLKEGKRTHLVSVSTPLKKFENMFDNVVVLYQGAVLYYGKATRLPIYLISKGVVFPTSRYYLSYTSWLISTSATKKTGQLSECDIENIRIFKSISMKKIKTNS